MILYMCVVIGIGVYFYKRAQKNASNYFLGWRSLGLWVAAMSAEASDEAVAAEIKSGVDVIIELEEFGESVKAIDGSVE